MSVIFDVLYHWSPAERRIEILREGLKPYSQSVVHSGNLLWPYICLSTRPSRAWGLSGDFADDSEIDEWDLWEVRLPLEAEVHIRPFWGNVIDEIKVRTAIPADYVWYVATRQPFSAINSPLINGRVNKSKVTPVKK